MTMWYLQDASSYQGGRAVPTRSFHRRLLGYAPSPLVRADGIARELGLGEVWVKDESNRMGLPSFKILGASWATYRALQEVGGFGDDEWSDVAELGALVARTSKVRRLAAATDGNHGRAVAHIARLLGLEASIYVPADMVQARIDAIASEGASVEVVDGGYGDTVLRSAEQADQDCLIISDTSWPGYEDVPSAVIDGYSTIFDEVYEQLGEAGGTAPSTMVVQAGVGALAAASVRNCRDRWGARMVAVEPLAAACNLESARAGELVSIPGPHDSIMAGLNCDTPSLVAWPDVSTGIDAFVAVDDESARQAMRSLAGAGVVAGETGAAGLAGLRELCVGAASSCREELELGLDSSVLIISTEGATDPEAYARIVSGAQDGGSEK
ncbi:diaminopropionate ammonia-lyase [Saccharopolyspora sp. NPDC002376]